MKSVHLSGDKTPLSSVAMAEKRDPVYFHPRKGWLQAHSTPETPHKFHLWLPLLQKNPIKTVNPTQTPTAPNPEQTAVMSPNFLCAAHTLTHPTLVRPGSCWMFHRGYYCSYLPAAAAFGSSNHRETIACCHCFIKMSQAVSLTVRLCAIIAQGFHMVWAAFRCQKYLVDKIVINPDIANAFNKHKSCDWNPLYLSVRTVMSVFPYALIHIKTVIYRIWISALENRGDFWGFLRLVLCKWPMVRESTKTWDALIYSQAAAQHSGHGEQAWREH